MRFHVYKHPRQPALASVSRNGKFYGRVPMDLLIRTAAQNHALRQGPAEVSPTTQPYHHPASPYHPI